MEEIFSDIERLKNLLLGFGKIEYINIIFDLENRLKNLNNVSVTEFTNNENVIIFPLK